MGDPAKKLEAAKPPAYPDPTQPVELEYWYLPYNLGTLTHHQVTLGANVLDGCGIGGLCKRLTLHPGGVVIAEIHTGFVPGRLPSEQKVEVKYLILTGGHGKVKS